MAFPKPLASDDLHTAFQHAELSVLAVASGGTSKWALVDPDGCVDHQDGKWAAGVPVQLVPLPAESLFDVPLLPAEYETRSEDERGCGLVCSLARATLSRSPPPASWAPPASAS